MGTRPVGDAPPSGSQQYCVLETDGGRPIRHGAIRMWDDKGRKVMEGTYERGKLVGSVTFWSPDGNKAAEGPMNANGEKHGLWTEWQADSSSQKTATLEGKYENDLKEGDWTTTTGDVRVIGPFKKGKAEGLFSTYDAVLNLKSGETLMSAGEIVWTMAWDPVSGATVKKCYFKKGTQDRCETFLDPDRGNPSSGECDGVFRAEKAAMDRCTSGCPRGGAFGDCADRCAGKRSKIYSICHRTLMKQAGVEE
mgnify:FL=1